MATTSKFGRITELLIAHLLTSGVVTSAHSNWGGAPVVDGVDVDLTWGGGFTDQDCNGVLRRRRPFNLRIRAGSSDAIETAFETILTLWYDAARREALSALGVTSILPRSDDPPIVWPGQGDNSGGSVADFQFNVQVEFNY